MTGFDGDEAAAELAALLLSCESFDELLRGVAGLAVRVVDGAASGSITLVERERVITVAAVDAVALQLDQHQYEQGAGPCLEALHTCSPVHVPDMHEERRWEDFRTVALDHGVRGVLSLPLTVRDSAVGVLNLFTRTGFDERDLRLARVLAAHAAVAVTAALRTYDQVTLTEHLRTALSSRSVIDQAIGVVMAREGCTADEAFGLLRKVSQQRNIKLRQVAADLVAAIEGAARSAG